MSSYYIKANSEDGTLYYQGNDTWSSRKRDAALWSTEADALQTAHSIKVEQGRAKEQWVFNIHTVELLNNQKG